MTTTAAATNTNDEEILPHEGNPLKNKTDYATSELSVWEKSKMILMTITGISILRMIAFYFFTVVAVMFIVTLMYGYHPRDKNGQLQDISRLRRYSFFLAHFCARAALFSIGYHYIKETYPKPDPDSNDENHDAKPFIAWPSYVEREGAPRVIIANHVSFLDSFYIVSKVIPSCVAQAEMIHFPIIGWALQAMVPVLVPVTEKQRAELPPAKQLIAERLQTPNFTRPLLIFPEGTTTQANMMVKFQDGAFLNMAPVQPIILKYGDEGADPSWTIGTDLVWLVFRLCCQVYNKLEVEYLPVVDPKKLAKPLSPLSTTTTTTTTTTMAENQTVNSTATATTTTTAAATTVTVEEFKQHVYQLYLDKGHFKKSSLTVTDNHFMKPFVHNIDYVFECIYCYGKYNTTAFRTTTGLNNEKLTKLFQRFYYCDHNKDGWIVLTEFLLLFPLTNAHLLFQHLLTIRNNNNSNKNGIVDDAVTCYEVATLFKLFKTNTENNNNNNNNNNESTVDPVAVELAKQFLGISYDEQPSSNSSKDNNNSTTTTTTTASIALCSQSYELLQNALNTKDNVLHKPTTTTTTTAGLFSKWLGLGGSKKKKDFAATEAKVSYNKIYAENKSIN